MKPTVFERLRGRFRILKITSEYPRTLDKDLSIRSDLDFHPRQGLPHLSDLQLTFTAHRGDARSLCLAISFDERESNGIEEFDNLRRDRRGSRVSHPYAIKT